MLSDDLLITPTLLRRFEAEAELDGGDGRHHAILLRDNGDLIAHNPGSPELPTEKLIWARDLLRFLNREIHHDGAWVVVFTHPRATPVGFGQWDFGRWAIIHLDQDGDPQFTIEWAENEISDLNDFSSVVLAGLDSWIMKAETAWQLWHLHMRQVIEPKQDQLFKRALGERPKSAH